MTPNAAGKTALEGQERGSEQLSGWRGTEAGGVTAGRTPRRGRGAHGRLDDESTGALLERELLLVQPPSRLRPALRLGRLLRAAGVAGVFLLVGGGVTWGVLELRRSWQASLDDLQGRLDRLSAENVRQAAENVRQAAVVVELRRANEDEARARQTETRELAELMQKTLVELESTVGRLQELRAEKDALAERYEQLRTTSTTGSFERFLGRLVPRWLIAPEAKAPEAKAPEASADTDGKEGAEGKAAR